MPGMSRRVTSCMRSAESCIAVAFDVKRLEVYGRPCSGHSRGQAIGGRNHRRSQLQLLQHRLAHLHSRPALGDVEPIGLGGSKRRS